VLDRAADAASSRAAEAAAGRGHEPERRAQAASAGIGQREHGLPGADVGDDRRVPGDGGRVAGVDGEDGDVEVGVGARDAAVRDLAVGSPDGHLLAAQHVSVGEHATVGDDDAGAAPPAASEPDDGRPDPLRHAGDGTLQLVEEGHVRARPFKLCRRRRARSPSKAGPADGAAASPPGTVSPGRRAVTCNLQVTR
jgi:hypothetical protein